MQLPINSIALAVVALSAFASASQNDAGSGVDNHRFIRKRAPAEHNLVARVKATADASLRLAKRAFSGQATFYDPSTGAGNCGKTFQKSDPIVAVNTAQFDLSDCFTWITVTANGKSARAQITDSCPSCSYGSLDFSPAVFNQFATPDDGVFQMSWVFGSGEASATSSRRTRTHTTPTSTYTPPTTTSTPRPTTRRTRTTTSSTYTPTTSSSYSTRTSTSSSSSTSTTTRASSSSTSSSSSSSTSASSTSSAASATATDDGEDQDASQTSSGDESVETLGSGKSNNLGLLSQAVGGFAAIAQAVSDNSDSQ